MDFEIYSLKIFANIMKFKSFSQTAREMGITQPTVSQQMGKLEARLGKKLFERVGHEIIPTPLSHELLKYAHQITSLAEDCENFLLDQKTTLKGSVRYAMPESCQWTPHFRRIMQQISSLPELDFKIGILPSDKIARGLIENEYDFGFIVGEKLHPELRFEKFAEESYVMVAMDESYFLPLQKNELSSLRLIAYPGWESFSTCWFKTFGYWEDIKKRLKTPVVHIGNLAGAIHAVQEGAGVAIFPLQCISAEMETGKLKSFSPKNLTASQPIYLSRRVGDILPRRSETVLEMLKQSKRELP